MTESSEIPGFYKLSPAERMKVVQKLTGITDEEAKTLGNTGGLPPEVADRMIENVVGGMTIPLGIAVNFLINGKDYLIPMALEEPSVVAAASNAAKMARVNGGFRVTHTGPIMVGEIQGGSPPDPDRAQVQVLQREGAHLGKANHQDPSPLFPRRGP